MSLALRPRQIQLYNDISSAFNAGRKTVLAQAPTGFGKTVLVAKMAFDTAAKRKAVVFLVHRRELVTQSMRAFHGMGVKFGVIASGFQSDPRHLVQIASVQTLVRRLGDFGSKGYTPPALLIEDECQHVAAGTWATVRSAFSGSYKVGLTATPQRLDGKGLSDYYSTMVHGPTTAWLIENGYLVRPRVWAPGGIDTKGIRIIAGDYDKAQLAKAATDAKRQIVGNLIRHYNLHAKGKRIILFGASVELSQGYAAELNAAGIRAEHVDGETATETRDAATARFAQGYTLALSNVDLFGEGYDVPAVDAIGMLRPTASLSLYLQQVGRALRPVYAAGYDLETVEGRLQAIAASPKPYAVILDFAGNVALHGLPDTDRTWTLQGRGSVRASASGSGVRTCPKCFAALKPGTMVCLELDAAGIVCGYAFQTKPRDLEHVDGDLVEVRSKEDIAREAKAHAADAKRRRAKAKTLNELVAFAREEGYKQPEIWALNWMRIRNHYTGGKR